MPVISAKRAGPCSVCGGHVVKGEQIHYTLATGPVHLTCEGGEPEARRNRHPMDCQLCGVELKAGQGLLSCYETARGSEYRRVYSATCTDAAGCHGRIVGTGG